MAEDKKQTETKQVKSTTTGYKAVTTDGKPKKQGEKYTTELFGVKVVTNY